MQLGDNQLASECASYHLKTAQLINDERYINMANEDLIILSGEVGIQITLFICCIKIIITYVYMLNGGKICS